jgi:Transketolase, C-terminal domain/Dehydrogenase E1 component
MTDPAGTDLTREDPAVLREYYRQMALIRSFELRAAEMYTRARIGGYCHLNLGEEATVVGLTAALRDKDYLFATYREHGYALARGADPGRVMAELFGRADGLSRGRGGSMHLFDPEHRLLGGYGIVGGQIPLATGAAFALAYRGGPAPDAPAVMCLDVARRLEDDGISAEVIDLRSLRPLDRDTICASARKTSRAVIVEDDWLSYGTGAEIAATIAEGAFDYLDAPVRRVAAAEVPLPYAKPLELAALPDAAAISRAVRETLGGS